MTNSTLEEIRAELRRVRDAHAQQVRRAVEYEYLADSFQAACLQAEAERDEARAEVAALQAEVAALQAEVARLQA